MIVRLCLLVAASVAAFAVTRGKTANAEKASENGGGESEVLLDERREKLFADGEVGDEEKEKLLRGRETREDKFHQAEEEEEDIKRINDSEYPSLGDFPLENVEGEEEEGLPELEELFSGAIDFALDEFDGIPDHQHAIEKAVDEAELERLRSLVRELEEREAKVQTELLEYYGLKEQESDVVELQKQLNIKTAEIDMLRITIDSLQTERTKLREEIVNGISAKENLEVARNKIKELQRQIQLEVGQTKGEVVMLRQHVTSLRQKEEETKKTDAEIERKLKALKELEVEVVQLRRKNEELRHEKRELSMKLGAAESRASALSKMTESELSPHAREDVKNLRHANEDLAKQVEGLQMNRFSEVEELVYLRWVNACLKYELRNYQTPSGKLSTRDLNKNPSPRSQEKAKRLLLEYAGSERGQDDTDLESTSVPSSTGSDDLDTASIGSHSSKTSNRRSSLIQKLRRWGKSKDDYGPRVSPKRSFEGNFPRRTSSGSKSSTIKDSLEALMLRNAGDVMAITTFGQRAEEPNGLHNGPNFSSTQAQALPINTRNSIAESFQLMSKSIEGFVEDKYPAYKDRHKLAMEREKAIKEKAEQARVERFGGLHAMPSIMPSKHTWERPSNLVLAPEITQLEKVGGTSDTTEPSNESRTVHVNDNAIETPMLSKIKLAHIEKRAPRVPRPPPRSSGVTSTPNTKAGNMEIGVPPPPPPPPPPHTFPRGSALKGPSGGKVHRSPELVEFYQSLMKREAKNSTSIPSSGFNVEDARSSMIREIANRSEFLLAVKADVETQGDFVNSLATEVQAASFTSIEDLVSFVNWLDEELSFLVDERAVLRHFDWPESKADALREAAFEYQDLSKLENQVSTFVDDPKLPCEPALKKMYALLEKTEQSVYALLRTRDMAISRYKEFRFPVDWLMDSGGVGKIKLASIRLARKYMKRVSSELEAMVGTEKEPNREFLILQGIRFAFRVHQFAGGFDMESMQAFEDLRSRVTLEAPYAGKS